MQIPIEAPCGETNIDGRRPLSSGQLKWKQFKQEKLQILGPSAAQGCKPASSSVILLLKATEPGSSEGYEGRQPCVPSLLLCSLID